MELQARSKIFRTFSSSILRRKTSLEITTSKKIKDPQYFSYIIARVK